ncbi:hypothetical protein [Acidovorax sp. ACV01]|uniref:hypothetical protein n=1 Tax=Acidovorax sp. ACV01 TaxID=2769311 RepID=UPI00177FFC5E|nr:hypothetical protein [Acidovorax sp. ACV01]MBD9392616.1 hypothetical protein [Acidovorax sp. ACV01]
MLNQYPQGPKAAPKISRALAPLRTTWALGISALALAGCGGSSGDATQPPPPPSNLAAPSNFTVSNLGTFGWNATPGATRYELYVDPDGAGPLKEAKPDDLNQASGTGFTYSQAGTQGFWGSLYATASSLATTLNSTYRLRACDATGCGAFTDSKAYDIANGISYEFASGRVALKSSLGSDAGPRLSQDALTLAISSPSANAADSVVYVFTRANSAQLWQQQAVLGNGKAQFGGQVALSADGGTLAVLASETTGGNGSATKGVVYLYQRSGSAWNLQGQVEAPSAPATCTLPCRTSFASLLTLSSDGGLLAASVGYSTASGVGSTSIGAVATYTRTAGAWTPQALMESGGKFVSSLALSGDGSTLAVNEDGWRLGDLRTATTPAVRIFVQQGNGNWTQQARLPAGLVSITDTTGLVYSNLALSSDGSTLAVHASNVPGHPTSELDIKPSDLTCPGLAEDGWYIGLYKRTGSTWQRRLVASRGLSGPWALAPDGTNLFYGNSLFNYIWVYAWLCP